MNLKEYFYCKRHHPKALQRVLGIKEKQLPTWDGSSYYIEENYNFNYYDPSQDTLHFITKLIES